MTYPVATVRVLGRTVDLEPPNVQHASGASFGTDRNSMLQLVGYDLLPHSPDLSEIHGSDLGLTLHWQSLGSMETRYKVFVHLIGDASPFDILAQVDFYPALPTTSWIPGEYLADHVELGLPDSLPPGDYRLQLGLYDESSGERLLLLDDAGEPSGSSLVLQELSTEE
jgi:hypothetical protein